MNVFERLGLVGADSVNALVATIRIKRGGVK